MGALLILTPIALFPGVGLAAFSHLVTVTVGTENRNTYYRLPLSVAESYGTQRAESPELKHYRKFLGVEAGCA